MSYIKADNIASQKYFAKMGWSMTPMLDGNFYLWCDRPSTVQSQETAVAECKHFIIE